MMIKNIIVGLLLVGVVLPLEAMKDQDFDGVADEVDECPNTSFFEKVDARGCTIEILTLPNETEKDSLQLLIGYGVIINEDLLGREEQRIETLKLNYYRNSWAYSLGSGYYHYNDTDGLIDTTLKVQKRFSLTPILKFSLGGGVKLPTYDFQGNKTDYTLYSSLIYYPIKSLSLFGQFKHTFVQDEEIGSKLHDSEYITGGLGYFITKKFYLNATYTEGHNKFVNQHDIKSISSLLYYKFNKKWFALFSYNREIDDEDAHHTYTTKIGYRVW